MLKIAGQWTRWWFFPIEETFLQVQIRFSSEKITLLFYSLSWSIKQLFGFPNDSCGNLGMPLPTRPHLVENCRHLSIPKTKMMHQLLFNCCNKNPVILLTNFSRHEVCVKYRDTVVILHQNQKPSKNCDKLFKSFKICHFKALLGIAYFTWLHPRKLKSILSLTVPSMLEIEYLF